MRDLERRKVSQRAYYQKHAVEAVERVRKWRLKNPNGRRDADFRREYGISHTDYDRMYTAQRGKCAICGRHQNDLEKKLVVDHSHVTGRVRALLCHPCNLALGLFQDSSGILQKAATYLERFDHNGF